jgi:predicted metal-dependent hydrolase
MPDNPDTNRPAVVIAGASDWADRATARLHELSYTPIRYTERTNYVARLADNGAALILVDGVDDDWRFWTVTPKTSPATRRIPIILVTDDDRMQQAALTAGANLVLSSAELAVQLPDLLETLARVPDPALVARMDEQCGQPLPPDGLEAVRRFNTGEYYKQHDLFEALWMQETGPVRDLYRAVLQVGIAYYQITRGNGRGAHKMLLRSVQWLALLPDACQGIDIASLRADSARVRAELERLGMENIAGFDLSLLKPVRLVSDPPS